MNDRTNRPKKIIHVEDEIRKHKGLWNFLRSALLRTLSENDKLSVSVTPVGDADKNSRIFRLTWTSNGNEKSAEIATFADLTLLDEYLKESAECQLHFIVDIMDQAKRKVVLEDNLETVQPYISNVKRQLVIYSAYCAQEMDKYRMTQKIAESDVVLIPDDWNLPCSGGVPLQEIMLSKTEAPSLSQIILGWITE